MHEMALGRYQLEQRLGTGGTADVSLATDLETGRIVAVKRLLPSAAGDPVMVERLRREAVAAASVRHPNIVPVLDAGPGVVVFAHVPGEPLAEVLGRGPLPPEAVTRLACDLGDALAAVHAAGLVHGDVTPSNVIVDSGGQAWLADFGAAVASADERFGTPGFIAPEVLAGATPSPAADVWALGAVLHEALTGVPLRLGDAAMPPRLGAGALPMLIAEMLGPDPADRPGAAAVVRTLTPGPMAVTQPIHVSAPPPTPASAAAVPPTLGRVRGIPARRTTRAVRARLGLVAAAGALLAAGLVLAAAGPAGPTGAHDPSLPTTPAPTSTTTSQSPTPAPTTRPKPVATPGQRITPRSRGRGRVKPHGGKSHGPAAHGGPPKSKPHPAHRGRHGPSGGGRATP